MSVVDDSRAQEVPTGCGQLTPGPTHLNFILPSTTWLSTIADVILGTREQAVCQALPPKPTTSVPGATSQGSPGRKVLWLVALVSAVPHNGHWVSPLS
jgi:hypothetical protein